MPALQPKGMQTLLTFGMLMLQASLQLEVLCSASDGAISKAFSSKNILSVCSIRTLRVGIAVH